MKVKVWHISDTHGHHNLLSPPEDIDITIFSGDCSNWRDIARNSVEVNDFLWWFNNNVHSKYKVMVAGNHDTSIESGFIPREKIEEEGIHYLYNEEITLGGIVMWGSPFTPTYGEWAFMKKRGKLSPLWENIPENLDILITHGPPKGILDNTLERNNTITQAGDKELWNRIEQVKPKYHMFGHIHNCDEIMNQGTLKLNNFPTTFSNGSVVYDGKFGNITNNGNIFEI